ncbi:twitching motility protein PilT [Candidatus Magnetomorum sp. HK-1]|nr:twitching motility protein PilT [Candidatus Magnetomorum sp. HK-1]
MMKSIQLKSNVGHDGILRLQLPVDLPNQEIEIVIIIHAVQQKMNLLCNFFSPFECLPFDDDCAEEYGKIRSDLSSRGLLIGPNDLIDSCNCKSE